MTQSRDCFLRGLSSSWVQYGLRRQYNHATNIVSEQYTDNFVGYVLQSSITIQTNAVQFECAFVIHESDMREERCPPLLLLCGGCWVVARRQVRLSADIVDFLDTTRHKHGCLWGSYSGNEVRAITVWSCLAKNYCCTDGATLGLVPIRLSKGGRRRRELSC